MTGDPLLDLAVSVGGVTLLYVVLVLLGARRTARLDAAEAARRFAAAGLVGEVAVDREGRGAVVVAGGEAGVLTVLGDRCALRRLARPVDARVAGEALVVDPHDLGFPPVRLVLVDPAGWVARLGAAP